MMKISVLVLAAMLGISSLSRVGAQTRPADLPAGHWAEKAVMQVLDNRLLPVESGKFRGESKVTRTQGVIALASLAKSLEKGAWKQIISPAVPPKADAMTEKTAWEVQIVSRYTLATVLTKFGNYYTNGIRKGTKDLAKSEALPPKPKITLSQSHPAYASLTYLAEKQMLRPGSVLLKPDNTPLRANELSTALSDMAMGLNNLQTELGRNEDDSTPDESFHKKKP